MYVIVVPKKSLGLNNSMEELVLLKEHTTSARNVFDARATGCTHWERVEKGEAFVSSARQRLAPRGQEAPLYAHRPALPLSSSV